MSRRDEIKSRLLRLLGPHLHPTDLAHLFLWLRDRDFVSDYIREIGDFVAHADAREKGPVTDDLRDYLIHARMMHRLGPSVDLARLPPEFTPTILRNFDRLPRPLIEGETGQRWKDARLILVGLLSKFGPASDDGITIMQKSVTEAEIKVLLCVLQHYETRAVFTVEQLVPDFLKAAQKNGLIGKVDREDRRRLKPLLTMFALQAMHRTVIVLEDNWQATLNAGTYQGELAVFASAIVETHVPGERIGIRLPVFTSGIPAREWCDDALEVGEYVVWRKLIELSPERKLVTLELAGT